MDNAFVLKSLSFRSQQKMFAVVNVMLKNDTTNQSNFNLYVYRAAL